MKKYIALFDWDNTVRNNYSFDTYVKVLLEKNIISKDFIEPNSQNMQDYLSGKISHDELSRRFIKILGKHIKGVDVQATKEILPEYKLRDNAGIYSIMKEKIFPFLNKNNIEIIVVSGGFQDALECYQDELNIDKIYAISFEIKNGKFTEKMPINIGVSENKQLIVDKIISENPNSKILFGFGDSISDIPLLNAAEYAFVNNKKEFLKKYNISYLDFSDSKSGDIIVQKMNEILTSIK